MITRRSILQAGGGIGLLVAHQWSHGQPAATVRRVGLLWTASETASKDLRVAFMQGMQGLGWIEGKNVEYRFAYADGDVTRLDALVRELIAQKVEVIMTSPTATRAAQSATTTIPIVMAGASNPLGNRYVASLAKPGGNTTGIANQQEQVVGKLIGVLHEIAPGARRFAILFNESNPAYPVFWAAAQSACAALGLVALRVTASASEQFGAAVAEIVRQQAQAVVVLADGMFYAERVRLQELLQTTRLPVAYSLREHVVAGGLLSYAADLTETFRRAAKFVDRILKGAKPADLPVELETKYELLINLRTAKALGITIPPAVLLRADEVIQ